MWFVGSTFYDHIHTTGTDIKQSSNAIAVQTLGKDMSWRDYAQGAYRMRGIGKGQTIRMLVIPEVKGLVQEAKTLCGQGDVTDATFVIDVAAWLYLNGMKSEQMQSIVLSKQDVQNLARKTALGNVMRAVDTNSLHRYGQQCQLERDSIAYFEETVNLSPADTINPPKRFAEQLQSLAEEGRDKQLIDGGSGWSTVEEIIGRLQGAGEAAQGLDGMMEQEQEQEEQKQKEQEQELEIIILPQQDEGRREPLRWDIRLLQQHTPTPESLGFCYPLADFETPRKFSQEERRAMRDHAATELGVMMTDREIDLTLARQSGTVKLGFPRSILVTHNFCDSKETAGSHRSLRHASAMLLWSSGRDGPDVQANTIALTLAEAETIRCALQQRHRVIAGSRLQIGLVSSGTVVASTEAARAAALRPGPEPGSDVFLERPLGSESDQVCLIFFNSDRDRITRSHGKILMQCLHQSTRHERKTWFESVCDMRRSADHGSWRSVLSLLSLFSLDDAEQLDKLAALRRTVADTMDEQGLTVIDVDDNGDGCIQVNELVVFISRLLKRNGDLQPRHVDIEALVRDADLSNDGVLQYDEFRACACILYLTARRHGTNASCSC